jgi:hypothetical protein
MKARRMRRWRAGFSVLFRRDDCGLDEDPVRAALVPGAQESAPPLPSHCMPAVVCFWPIMRIVTKRDDAEAAGGNKPSCRERAQRVNGRPV